MRTRNSVLDVLSSVVDPKLFFSDPDSDLTFQEIFGYGFGYDLIYK